MDVFRHDQFGCGLRRYAYGARCGRARPGVRHAAGISGPASPVTGDQPALPCRPRRHIGYGAHDDGRVASGACQVDGVPREPTTSHRVAGGAPGDVG